jgi:hypothetical protein
MLSEEKKEQYRENTATIISTPNNAPIEHTLKSLNYEGAEKALN